MLGGIQRWSSMTPIPMPTFDDKFQPITVNTTSSAVVKMRGTKEGTFEIVEALSDAVDEAMDDPETAEALERLAMLVELEIELEA